MTVSVLRTADGWWVRTPAGAARVDTTATTAGQLLADRDAIDAAASSTADTIIPTDAPTTAPTFPPTVTARRPMTAAPATKPIPASSVETCARSVAAKWAAKNTDSEKKTTATINPCASPTAARNAGP